MTKYVAPSVKLTAFSCPHCGVLTTQFWYDALANGRKDEAPTPFLVAPEQLAKADWSDLEKDEREKLQKRLEMLASGVPHLDRLGDTIWASYEINNLSISKCYSCKRYAIWIYDRLAYPRSTEAPPANVDLPDQIKSDYVEAGAILNESPRGAAALLRLCVQKLCKELGETGKNINDDIAGLVSKGLDVRVQQALDIVRVVGNNAVHPGQIDLKDDHATAVTLFQLINVIADKMISEPKHIDDVFASLPEDAKKAIEKRDRKKP